MTGINREVSMLVARRKNEMNLRLADLAKLSGVSANTIINVTSGKVDPTLGNVERLLEAVGYEIKLVPTEKLKQEQEQKRLRETFYRN